MQRRLTLLRHAHAADPSGGGRDFDRPLSALGRDEAASAARRLAHDFGAPQCLRVSPALRTRETAEALEAAGLRPVDTAFPPALYLAAVDVLCEVVRAAPAAAAHLMLVGHNPGLSDLAARVDPGLTRGGLGTAGWLSVLLELDTWDDFAP